MPFNQPAPELGNQYTDDRVLRSYLERALPAEVLAAIEPQARRAGRLAGGELVSAARSRTGSTSRCIRHGMRGATASTTSKSSPLWKLAERLAAERGLIATAYERAQRRRYSRIHQFALVHSVYASHGSSTAARWR